MIQLEIRLRTSSRQPKAAKILRSRNTSHHLRKMRRKEHPAPPTQQKAPEWTSQLSASGVLCKERFAIFAFLTHSLQAKDSRAQRHRKKITYQWRVKEIERGTFTPLVFTVQGGCGRECDAFQLSEKIAKKSGEDQSAIMAWIRTKLSFALVRTGVVCLRGWRKKDKRKHTENKETEFAISTTESKATT